MCIVGTPEAEDSTKIMKDHGMVGDSKLRQVEEFKILLEDNILEYSGSSQIISTE